MGPSHQCERAFTQGAPIKSLTRTSKRNRKRKRERERTYSLWLWTRSLGQEQSEVRCTGRGSRCSPENSRSLARCHGNIGDGVVVG